MNTELTIRRMTNECAAPRGVNVVDLERRLSECVRNRLPKELESALLAAPAAWRNDDGVIIIPRVELDLDLDLAADNRTLGAVWARALARLAFIASTHRQAVRFDSQAHYLASFISDVASGQPWRWFFQGFEGLRVLDRPAQIRTALLRDPIVGVRALSLLSVSSRRQVLGHLNRRTALDIFHRIVGAGSRTKDLPPEMFRALLRSWDPADAPSASHLVLTFAAESPAALAAAQAVGATRLLALAEIAMELSGQTPDQRAEILGFLERATATDAARLGLPVTLVSALRALSPAERRSLAAPIQAALSDDAQMPTATPDYYETRFGGALVLWPMVQALPLDVLSDWPGVGDRAAPDVVRWLVLCRCFGRDEDQVLCDPLLSRLFLGPGSATGSELRAWWVDSLDESRCCGLLQALGNWFLGEGVTAAEWRDLRIGDASIPVLKADKQGYWLCLGDWDATDVPPGGVSGPPETDAKDLAVLARPDLSDRADLILAQLAQVAVKRMLYRIPGYTNSSVGYALATFLSMPATVTWEEDRIVAALGSAPLSLMLNLTGLSRQNMTAGPGEHRTVILCQEPGA